MKRKSLIAIIFLSIILVLVGCNETAELEGISIFDMDKNYVVDYMPKEKTHLANIINEKLPHEAAIITRDGAIEQSTSDIYLDSNRKGVFSIDYNGNKIEDIIGIYISENYYRNSDAYYDMKSFLDNNEKVMVILLDGFSYEQYKFAKDSGHLSFLPKYYKNEALSVYTPVTNAGFAAIITGQTPDVNGVHDRSFRELKVPSVFEYALKNNRKPILLEGDIKILNTEIEPELHLDMNKDGDIDDEVFETALKTAQEDYDLIFIHFHGIDDRGHSFGPMGSETLNYIKKIDTYIEELDKVWNGVIIATADHGMHEDGEAGSHGSCIYEDMVVPYFIKGN